MLIVQLNDKELAMELLNELHYYHQKQNLFLDTMESDSNGLSCEFGNSPSLQEKKRLEMNKGFGQQASAFYLVSDCKGTKQGYRLGNKCFSY